MEEATKPRFTQTTASVMLDLVRGLAAMLVLASHWRNSLFVDYADAPHGWAWMYALTRAGHQAVLVFFVLSGYLIGRSVLGSMRCGAWSWKVYLSHRLVRLWVVLLPGLLLCAFWDRLGLRLGIAPDQYHGSYMNHMTHNVSAFLGWKVFVGNLFFLQRITVPSYGSDGGLITLAAEFWYYLLFPLGLVALRREFRWKVRALCGLLFVLAACFVRGGVLEMGGIWLLGVGLAVMPVPRLRASGRWVAVIVCLPLVLLVAHVRSLPGLVVDYGVGVATAVMLWVMLSAGSRVDETGLFVRGSRCLAGFSYTLYVVHQPLLLFGAALLIGDARWRPSSGRFAEALALMLVVLLYAYAVAALTEFHTASVRGLVARVLARVARPAANPSRVIAAGE